MNCNHAQELLDAQLDHELDPLRSEEVATHLETCSSCRGAFDGRQQLQSLLRDRMVYFTAPRELRRSISVAIATAPADSASIGSAEQRTRIQGGRRWALAAAWLLTAGIAGWMLSAGIGGWKDDQQLAQEVVASHVRSLMAAHLTDVASSDRHVVKPWFATKLDFAPPVEDLSSAQFSLVGGRLDYLPGRSVAALVYQRRHHLINVFIWPEPQQQEPGRPESPRNGYNIARWNRGGMAFWAISDLNQRELDELATLLQTPH